MNPSEDVNNKIPYPFYPIPREFMTDEFIEDPVMMKIVRYIFNRVRPYPQKVKMTNNRRIIEVELKPFEFIFGRSACALECGISEQNLKTRLDRITSKVTSSSRAKNLSRKTDQGYVVKGNQQFLEKSTSSSTSTFTVYRVMTEMFKKVSDILSNQQFLEKSTSSPNHKQEEEQDVAKEFASLKETSKEKNVHNFETPRPPKGGVAAQLPLSNETTKKEQFSEEDVEAIQWALAEKLGIPSPNPRTIRSWLEKYSAPRVADAILLIQKRKSEPDNKMGWITSCLKNRWDVEDKNKQVNRQNFIRFREENHITSMKIFQGLARDESRDLEFDFKREPNELLRYANQKYQR